MKNADAHAAAAKLLHWAPIITIDRDPAYSGIRRRVQQLAINPNGRYLAILYRNGHLRLIEVKSGAELMLLELSRNSRLEFSPDSRFFLASDNIEGRLIDTANGKELLAIYTDGFRPRYAFSPDSRWLAVQNQHAIQIYDMNSGKEVSRVEGEGEKARHFYFSPNGRVRNRSRGKDREFESSW